MKKNGNAATSWIKENLNNFQLILIPIIFNHHWTLLTIDASSYEVTHFNSLISLGNDSLVKLVFKFAKSLIDSFDVSRKSWKYCDYLNVPQQTNGIDCGVFACTFAKYIAYNGSFNFDFNQQDIIKIRSKMFNEILKVELDFDELDVKFNPQH